MVDLDGTGRRSCLKPIQSERKLFILWLLKTDGVIGRYWLARMLGVSQGVARGMLAQMRREGLVTVRNRAGAMASSKGLSHLRHLMRRHSLKTVRRFDQEMLGLGPKGILFQISDGSSQLGQGIEQRDAAIKAGAGGAVTFYFDGKTLKFPGVAEPVSRRSPLTFKLVREQLKMSKGDVILIAFGPTWWDAARGGFAAVKTLE